MCYPLFFPRGEPGWSIHMTYAGGSPSRSNQKISAAQWYRYLLHDRVKDMPMQDAEHDTNGYTPEELARHLNEPACIFDPVMHGGRLLQQFIVDMWQKILSERLLWFRRNQEKITTETFRGIADALHDDLQEFGTARMRLPPSCIGCQRDRFGRYLDAMAMLRWVADNGRATFFITFTCNPNWPELKNALNGQSASDRPDLVMRVFLLKLAQLGDLLKQKHVLGYVEGFVQTIEFQKRYVPYTTRARLAAIHMLSFRILPPRFDQILLHLLSSQSVSEWVVS